MPNKPFHKLNSLDQKLRKAFPTGMYDGTRCKIEMITGFEYFNTRPYHNYETWGTGYRVSTPDGSVKVDREDLDDAIDAFIRKLEDNKQSDMKNGSN